MKGRKLKIFFSGLAGSGVSALAAFMADKGHSVAGSDRAFDRDPAHPLKQPFHAKGIIITPQDGSGLDNSFDFAVFSTAVEADQPEVLRARELKIPFKSRPEFLAEITASYDTIAVSGTSGKSTASGMLAFLMKELGLSPNFIGGGRVSQFKTPSNPGNSLTGSSDHLIIEACESDGSIVNYRPRHSIILNLALDHHAVDRTAGMFEVLISHTLDRVVINTDDGNLSSLPAKGAVTFSLDKPSDYQADQVILKSFSTDFSVHKTGFTLSLPGRHNLYNALSCIALLSELGIPLQDISAVLPEFQGIERRFDIHLNDGKHLVIDDYAHNPHKIASLMETVSRLGSKVCYIFQPHGFGPTRMMKKEYIQSFSENLRGSDLLILLPIFYAGGTAAKDIASHDLADGIKAGGKAAEAVESRTEALKRASDYDTVIVLGARDETLSDFAISIAKSVRKRESSEVRK